MIAIVGGGLTGLALAHELGMRGREHCLFEASARPGGVIRSARIGDRVLDFGPQRGRMTGRLAALVAALGIEPEVVYAPAGLPLYVYAEGALREAPFSLGALLRGRLLTRKGKLRLLGEPLTRGPRDDEPVATFLRRKIGREAYERLAGPLYGGLYASDPADMVVGLSLAPLLRELGVGRSLLLALFRRGGSGAPSAAFSFKGGMQCLTDALHAQVNGTVRLATPVRGLRKGPGGWVLELEHGSVEAEIVVLACEAASAARLLERVAPEAAGRLRRLVYNPLAVVHLHAPGARLRGLGYQVALTEDLVTRGVTWNDSLFRRDGVYTAFLGGASRPAVVDEPDDRLCEMAVREFARVTGQAADVLSVTRAAMPAWDVSWRALEGFELPEGIRVAGSWRGRPGIPGRLAEAAALAEELSRGYVWQP